MAHYSFYKQNNDDKNIKQEKNHTIYNTQFQIYECLSLHNQHQSFITFIDHPSTQTHKKWHYNINRKKISQILDKFPFPLTSKSEGQASRKVS